MKAHYTVKTYNTLDIPRLQKLEKLNNKRTPGYHPIFYDTDIQMRSVIKFGNPTIFSFQAVATGTLHLTDVVKSKRNLPEASISVRTPALLNTCND